MSGRESTLVSLYIYSYPGLGIWGNVFPLLKRRVFTNATPDNAQMRY